MNYAFSTGSERIAVIENLRRPEVLFPSDWNPLFSRQRKSKHLSKVAIFFKLTLM